MNASEGNEKRLCYNRKQYRCRTNKSVWSKNGSKISPPRRKRMKRPQRLESARSWLETYEGNKVVRDYRRRYGLSWEVALVELEMLQVPINPDYKKSVLQTAAVQAAVKRR